MLFIYVWWIKILKNDEKKMKVWFCLVDIKGILNGY